MKAFTSIEQSKKLAEILPLITADMDYIPIVNLDGEYSPSVNRWDNEHIIDEGWIPAWSLAALLNYMREIDFFPEIEADEHIVTMSINYYDEEEARLLAPVHNIKAKAESFIDACCELILKCHEQNIL